MSELFLPLFFFFLLGDFDMYLALSSGAELHKVNKEHQETENVNQNTQLKILSELVSEGTSLPPLWFCRIPNINTQIRNGSF